MRLTRLSWTSTFHFVVLISISCILVGVLTSVEAQKQREYTIAFVGSDGVIETVNDEPDTVKQAPPSPVPRRIHPIYEAREFLVEHNMIRKKLGEPPLVWDRTLAHYARRFAGQRAVKCDMIHSQGPYGENIYWGADYQRHTAAAAVRAWAGENNDYNPSTNACSPSKLCGHYKQIVWRTSTKLGCARAKCNSGGVYIICSYDPPGNYVGENPFDMPSVQGPPQSSQTPSTPVVQAPPSPAKATPTPVQTPPSPPAKTTPTPVQTPTTPAAKTTPTPVQTPTTPAAQKTPTSPSPPS